MAILAEIAMLDPQLWHVQTQYPIPDAPLSIQGLSFAWTGNTITSAARQHDDSLLLKL